jgi:tetrapyrrole methylase family protein / MazG family protein
MSKASIEFAVEALGTELLAGDTSILYANQLSKRLEEQPFSGSMLDVSPDRACLIVGLTSRIKLTEISTILQRVYPPTHEITVFGRGASGDQLRLAVSLVDLKHCAAGHTEAVWVPAMPDRDAWRSSPRLHRLIGHLRGPSGCPWDRAQTYQSLSDKVLEEAYEVVDAIAVENSNELQEELGDLLLLVTLLAQIAEERGDFTIEDVYETVNRKLVRRHPHVFAGASATTPDDVVITWKEIKSDEANERDGLGMPKSEFERLPNAMPALQKARQLYKAGYVRADCCDRTTAGNELLSLVNLMLEMGLDPEIELADALRRCVGQQ